MWCGLAFPTAGVPQGTEHFNCSRETEPRACVRGFCVRPKIAQRSEDSRKRAAVDRQILPGDEARLRRAKERAGGAEAVEIAQALGRDRGDALGLGVLVADAFALGEVAEHGLEPIGLIGAWQETV